MYGMYGMYDMYGMYGMLQMLQIIHDTHSTHHWRFSKSKFNLKSDRVHLVAPASPIKCLLYLPNVRAMQYKLGPERLTRLENSNVLRLPVIEINQPRDASSKQYLCSKQML